MLGIMFGASKRRQECVWHCRMCKGSAANLLSRAGALEQESVQLHPQACMGNMQAFSKFCCKVAALGVREFMCSFARSPFLWPGAQEGCSGRLTLTKCLTRKSLLRLRPSQPEGLH